MKPWDHPLIQKGMPLQLAKRRAASPPASGRSAGKSASARLPPCNASELRRRSSAI